MLNSFTLYPFNAYYNDLGMCMRGVGGTFINLPLRLHNPTYWMEHTWLLSTLEIIKI